MQIFQIINDSVNRLMFIHLYQENIFLKGSYYHTLVHMETFSVNKSSFLEEQRTTSTCELQVDMLGNLNYTYVLYQ